MATDAPGPSSLRPAGDPSDVDSLWRSAGWDTTPLFMRSLPASDPTIRPSPTDKVALEALQSLVYESSPEETVRQLKERGNELFKLRKWKEAKGFYDQAVQEVIEKPREEREQVVEIGAEVEGDVKDETRRAVYSNRAACNLELQNFASCLRDCAAALAPPLPSPSSPAIRKALFRSAKASFQLGKLDDSLDALDRLAALDEKEGRGKDKDGEALREKVAKRREEKQRQEQARQEREAAEKALGSALKRAFEDRGLLLPPGVSYPIATSALPPNVLPASFDPSATSSSTPPDPLTTPLTYPVYVLRPLADPPTRDLVLSWHEDAVIGDHLVSMSSSAPPYTPDTSSLYITTKGGRVLKMGKGLTLRKVIIAARKLEGTEGGADGIELLQGWALEIVWLPDGPAGKGWIDMYKSRNSK